MREVLLNGSQINDKADLYEAIREQLPVPDYFGNNLDALHDIISEDTTPVCLNIDNFERLQRSVTGPYLISLFHVIMDCGGEIHIFS